MKILFLLLLGGLAAPAWAEEAWEKEWNRQLAEARKEGTVVVVGAPDPVMRSEIVPRFSSRFGIPVQFISGNASQIAARIGVERSAGQYTADIYLGNPRGIVDLLYPQKMIDPLKPALIHPEASNGSKWKRGKPRFIDPEEKYVLRVFSSVNSLLHINTQYVKPEEMRSTRDLLNPKWKGKIVTEDPTRGKGAFRAAKFYRELGEEFVAKLYLEQKPVFSRDRRQINDWLARGVYPICFTCRDQELAPLRKDGFQFLEVFELTDMKGDLGASPTPSFARKDPALTKDILRAYLEAIHAFKTDRKGVFDILGDQGFFEDRELIDAWYETSAGRMSAKPYPTPESLEWTRAKAVIDYPETSSVNPLRLFELSYLSELDQEGFIDRLWAGKETPG